MKIFVCLLAVVVLAQAKNLDNYKHRDLFFPIKGLPSFTGHGRIVGGQEATPHQFPHQAALFIDTSQGSFFCGGSLISRNYVLTAAHCVDGAQSVLVILGAHRFRENEEGQERIYASKAFTHPKWDSYNLVNDLALIKLQSAVTLSSTIKTITLPSRSDASKTYVNTLATVSGWGRDSDQASGVSEVLRYVSAYIMTNKDCDSYYGGYVKPTNVCASGEGGKSSCNGDSGGPLTVNEDNVTKQIGIVSFGRVDGCEKGIPHVYTRVTSYLDWIEQNTDVQIN